MDNRLLLFFALLVTLIYVTNGSRNDKDQEITNIINKQKKLLLSYERCEKQRILTEERFKSASLEKKEIIKHMSRFRNRGKASPEAKSEKLKLEDQLKKVQGKIDCSYTSKETTYLNNFKNYNAELNKDLKRYKNPKSGIPLSKLQKNVDLMRYYIEQTQKVQQGNHACSIKDELMRTINTKSPRKQ